MEVALTQLGNEGGQPYWSWYGFDGRVEWCACFVSWCADQCGYIESGIIPKFSGCVDGSNWFKGNGQWQDRNYEPQAGDIIFFDWEGDGETDHVGIVEKCENGVVYTVEGNSGDACRQNQYTVGSSSIYGYGVPASLFPELEDLVGNLIIGLFVIGLFKKLFLEHLQSLVDPISGILLSASDHLCNVLLKKRFLLQILIFLRLMRFSAWPSPTDLPELPAF